VELFDIRLRPDFTFFSRRPLRLSLSRHLCSAMTTSFIFSIRRPYFLLADARPGEGDPKPNTGVSLPSLLTFAIMNFEINIEEDSTMCYLSKHF
jgi:hypothetical protein